MAERAEPRGFLAGLLARARPSAVFAPTRQIAPVVILLVARWTTWLLGLGIVLLGGGSEKSQALKWPLLLGSFGLLLIGSLIAVRLFGKGWPRNRAAVALLTALDIAQSLGILWLEGGWSPAFYEFALTSVMLPAFVFSAVGVILATAAFSLGFLGILLTSPADYGGLVNFQVASLLNPWIVAAVVAVLADLLRRLERATARNLELAAREERWRIAREIHDGVAQQSYMLALGLETAVAQAGRDDLAGLQKGLPALEKLARQALIEVRQYVAEGRPLMLGERSLGSALAGLGREFATVSRVAIEIDAPDVELDLPPARQSAIYRLAQESLANVFKHAEARHAWVALRIDDEIVELEVADDGRGLDPAVVRDGLGLEGMRRRAAEHGGRFSIVPRPGGGTCVRVSFPR